MTDTMRANINNRADKLIEMVEAWRDSRLKARDIMDAPMDEDAMCELDNLHSISDITLGALIYEAECLLG